MTHKPPLDWLVLAIISVALVACNQAQLPRSHSQENQYFEETGHTVRGPFLQFFYNYEGPNSLGNPLSAEMEVDGWRVQYFEYGRLEYHPENVPAFRVTVGWLGDLLHRRHPPISPQAIPRADDPNHRYYPKTGHTLSGNFLHYFDTHGGSVRFGLPISEPYLLEGVLTQDFQSARFFWTPNAAQPVTLEAIGRVHLKKITTQNKK